MPFDLDAVRKEFWRLEETGGVIRTDRVPTREDIHARWHWRTERFLPEYGTDPATVDVGRDSFMLSGLGRPQLPEDEPVLEHRFRYDPMPLEWFDNSAARAVLCDIDHDLMLLEMLCGKHLAGWADRPTGTEMFAMLTEGAQSEDDRLMVRELLCDIRQEFYPMLRREDALSIWHLARAALGCEVKRGRLSWWLNQYAVKPDAGSAGPTKDRRD